jgi:hypothetical protein
MHVSPAQQSGLPPHISPSAPQVGAGAGWHTPNASSCALHDPEQQSAPEVHSSHSARQPPAGTHRFAPSLCIAHSREQQSLFIAQISPTCRVHPLWSFSLHMGRSAEQRPTDCGSSEQTSVQQSSLEPQISPSTRQPSRRAQRPPLHTWPQHSGLPPHASPAGLHMGGALAHWPPMQTSSQQSAATVHAAPATEHVGLSPHRRDCVSPPESTHAREQHCAANVHCDGSPRQPTAGSQTLPAPPFAVHQPEQH